MNSTPQSKNILRDSRTYMGGNHYTEVSYFAGRKPNILNTGNLKVMPSHFCNERLQSATATDKLDVDLFHDWTLRRRNPLRMEVTHKWRQKWSKMLRARYGETHLDFDLHDCPHDSRHGERHNTKENCRKVPSGKEAVVKCEILQRPMIQAQGKRNHKEREPSPDVGRKGKCIRVQVTTSTLLARTAFPAGPLHAEYDGKQYGKKWRET
jgi:hypothetical protein